MLIDRTNMVTCDNCAGQDNMHGRCVYCTRKIGDQHSTDCVCRKRVVMVSVTLTIPKIVPASWGEESINFYMNNGTWCADNIAHDIGAYTEAKNDGAQCLCTTFRGKFMRDATEEDLVGVDIGRLMT